MTNKIIERPSSIELPVPLADVQKLELLAEDCSRQRLAHLGPFERALTIAAGMQQIEAAISNEMMMAVMPLMNSKLGFLTDRDPSRQRKVATRSRPTRSATVRRCLIESLFHGLYPVGNEWNIIASGFYAAKNGLRRKIDEFPASKAFAKHWACPSIVPVTPRSRSRPSGSWEAKPTASTA